jgi:hypothetical protein
MNEKPKSIWKKSWSGLGAVLILALSAAVVVFLVAFIYALTNWEKPVADTFTTAVFVGFVFAACCLLAGCFVLSLRWLCWLFWTHWRRGLFALAWLATLIALFYAEEDWRGWHAWNQFKHEWEAKGEKFDFASVVPPPVPDDQNFAMAPIWIESIKATLGPERSRQWKYPDDGRTNFTDRMPMLWRSYDSTGAPTRGDWAKGDITDFRAWQAYYRAPAPTNRYSTIKTNEFPIAPQPQSPAEDVLLALSKYDSAIEELRTASKLPDSRFPLDYNAENPAGILLPHLALLKRSAQVLELRAIAELQNGQNEKTLDDAKLVLRLTDAVRTEPFLISHLVRVAMLEDCTLQPIYEGLVEHKWSAAQLVELDSELAKLDFLADYQNVQKSEIFFSAEVANFLRRHRDYANQFVQMDIRYRGDAKFQFAIYHFMPGGWFYQSALKNGRTWEEYLPAVNHDAMTISPALVQRADAAANNAISFFDPLDGLKRTFNSEFLSTGHFLKEIAYAQTSVDLARVAIALERYRLAHGGYPDSLDALVPQFIAKVPHDVIGGGPLHYRLTSDGQFVLYSIGWNERDDGGVVVLEKGSTPVVDINQGDWVWRYPQK